MNYLSLSILTLLLGLRHGIDWDHIAAITDITGSNNDKKIGFIYGTLYVTGHALVITILGLLAVVIGIRLPDWVDGIMEKIVGLTLIFLGIWLIFSLLRHGKNYSMKSRWMLLFSAVSKIHHFIETRLLKKTHHHHHITYPTNYGPKTAFSVGVLHGIGAETPTQMLLFITAAGVGGKTIGPFLVLLFVIGLALSNTIITLLSIYGFKKAQSNSVLYLVFGAVTGVFSLIVGFFFVFNKSVMLPVIFGG